MKIVDSRQRRELSDPFVRAGWVRQALPFGDYQFFESSGEVVLVEDKTVEKLLADMATGTLTKQCRGIAENSTFPILLIRGRWVQDADGKILGTNYTWEQAWNQLQSLQDAFGIRLQIAASTRHAIERIFELERYYAKGLHTSTARHPSGNSHLAALCLIPGLGTGKAKAILAKFPTLEAVVKASEEELSQVEGIGAKLAQRIWRFWRAF